jgi:hypothetical protein
MDSLYVQVTTRPIRIGWCVREGNFEDFRTALRLTHTMWGGCYNPVIPVGDLALASHLVSLYHLDILFSFSEDDPNTLGLLKGFPHLPWPTLLSKKLFRGDEASGVYPEILDVTHPLRRLRERIIRREIEGPVFPTHLDCAENDPLQDVVLATYGGFGRDGLGQEYRRIFQQLLKSGSSTLSPTDLLPALDSTNLTPNRVTHLFMPSWAPSPRYGGGFYLGAAGDFRDLVTYWNLRAAGVDVLFVDPDHANRFTSLIQRKLSLVSTPNEDITAAASTVHIWSRSKGLQLPEPFSSFRDVHHVDDSMWLRGQIRVPFRFIGTESTFGAVAGSEEAQTLTLQLPPIPWLESESRVLHQRAVFDVAPLSSHPTDDEITFQPFNLPELNEHYARNCLLSDPTAVRLTNRGMGIIANIGTTYFQLYALKTQDMLEKLFALHGIKTGRSQPGLIATRLIRQMGGLQGARVFKIAGVRKLIATHSPHQSFTKGKALQVISDVDSHGKSNFSEYENLHIETRSKPRLSGEDVFRFLVARGVFRAGLSLLCPSCKLESWVHLDELATQIECEFCGRSFNVAVQLRDRDWRYRRSGLFGRDDQQQGSIPVALTLQQLDTTLHYDRLLFSTGTLFVAAGASIPECEADLILLAQDSDGSINLALGECKTHDEITQQDVQNLGRVLDAFPAEQFNSYIILAKTGTFSPAEIALCRSALSSRHGVIMLSARELEPYYAYERVSDHPGVDLHAMTLREMVRNTARTYCQEESAGEAAV